MIDAINTAAAALRANEQWLDNISGNVSNINTPGYKVRDTRFDSAIQAGGNQGLIRATTEAPELTTGDIRQTGRDLDIAINGKGFFRVQNKDGTVAYTRLGHFTVDADGSLVAAGGWKLADDVAIPPDVLAIRIGTQGDVAVKVPDQAELLNVGAIRTIDIADLRNLQEASPGIYVDGERTLDAVDGTPGDGVLGHLQQGHLEYSNVDLVNEMSQLVIAQRAYQMNARVLQIGDQVMETINNLRR